MIQTIQNLFKDISQTLNGVIIPTLQNFFSQVQRGFNNVAANISAFLDPILQAMRQEIAGAVSILNSLPATVWNQLQAVNQDLKQHQNNLAQGAQNVQAQIFGLQSQTAQAFANFGTEFSLFAEEANNVFNQIGNIGSTIFQSLQSGVTNIMEGIKTQFVDPLLNQIRSFPDMIQNLIRPTGSITPEDARTMMFATGIPAVGGYMSINVVQLFTEMLTFGQVDELGEVMIDTLDDLGIGEFAKTMIFFDYETGVMPALRREVLRRYEPNIPGPGDLVNMVVKEAFVEELRTPAPETFAKFMKEHGFSKFWSDTWWTAHWNPIGFDRIIEMFHRGIIDEADFIRRLILLDFRPDDTEIMKELIFKLPNRLEARIMSRFGLLTDDQLDRILEAEGILPEFKPALKTMFQEFNLTNIFTRTESAATSAYEKGLIDESKFSELMKQIKRPPGVIEADLALGRFKRDLEFREIQVKAVEKALKRGQITPELAEDRLLQTGMDQEFIKFLMAQIAWELDVGVTANVKSKLPNLTATQITKAVKKEEISMEEGLGALEARGYSTEEADIFFKIKDVGTA